MLKIKRLQVDAYKVALVYKDGALESVLTSGKHWIGYNRELRMYDITKPFSSIVDLDILLKNEQLAEMLEIVLVKDHEIAIQYKNGLFNQVLRPGRYAFWKDGLTLTQVLVDLDNPEVDSNINKKVLASPLLSPYIKKLTVESYETGLLYMNGNFVRELKPGIYHFWNGENKMNLLKADLRTQQIQINGQELLTKDKASLRINLTTTYRIDDVTKALVDTYDSSGQLYSLMQMALREYVGQYTLDELLANKSGATSFLLSYAKDKSNALGYNILTAGIKDIILPGDV